MLVVRFRRLRSYSLDRYFDSLSQDPRLAQGEEGTAAHSLVAAVPEAAG